MKTVDTPVRAPGRMPVVGYISDRFPIAGPGPLLAQLRYVEEVARRDGAGCDAVVVDSGTAPSIDGRGARLQAFLEETQARRRPAVLITAGPGRLAYDAASPLATILALMRAGVILKDATGELHPEGATIEIVRRALLAAERHGAGTCSTVRNGSVRPKPAARDVQLGGAHA